MLTNDTAKLLKLMSKKDKWMSQAQIEAECKDFSSRSFKTITSESLQTVDSQSVIAG